jgi:putative glutamine amidotransferase
MARHATPPRPRIGILTDFPAGGAAHARVNVGYIDAVLAAEGLPVLIPPLPKDHFPELDTYLESLNGIIFTGGGDLDPRKYNQPVSRATKPMPARREESDRYVLAKVVERKMPVLGIGAGMQLLNVYFGGTLYQHLPADNPKAMPHFDPSGGVHRHMVNVVPHSVLDDLYGAPELRVNSTHHQGVHQLGRKFRVAAKAPDDLIEAIETTDPEWFCVGVQWHPECDTASALDRVIFQCLVKHATEFEPAELQAA